MVSSSPVVVIQSICTTWTKASRGGSNATARNAVTEALELPALDFPLTDDRSLLHEVVYTERDHFQNPKEKLEPCEQTIPFRYNCLKLSPNNQSLVLMLEWERVWGAPRRHAFPRTTWILQPGQWGRITYNLRDGGANDWIYKKYVISIGLFHSYAPRIFLEGEPTYHYSDMAHLW